MTKFKEILDYSKTLEIRSEILYFLSLVRQHILLFGTNPSFWEQTLPFWPLTLYLVTVLSILPSILLLVHQPFLFCLWPFLFSTSPSSFDT